MLDERVYAPPWNVQRQVLYKVQHGRCGACGGRTDLEDLVLDHDHVTALTRGLLCRACNVAEAKSDGPTLTAYRLSPPAAHLRWQYVDGRGYRAEPTTTCTVDLRTAELEDELNSSGVQRGTLASLFQFAIDHGWPYRRPWAQDQRAAEALGAALTPKPKRTRAHKAITARVAAKE